MLVGMYLPVLMTFLYSFNGSRISTVWTGFSLRGYRELFEQIELWNALWASCAIAASASSISAALGTMAALGLRRWRPRRAAAQGVLALPLVTPDVITAVALALFFSACGFRRAGAPSSHAHCVFGISYAFVVMRRAR